MEENNNGNNGKSQLQVYIEEREKEWLIKIKGLNEKLKTLEEIRDLQSVLITERQLCVDYYHKVLRMLSALNKEYRPLYSQKYNFYKTVSSIKYSSDSAINAQIQADLSDKIADIELMNNHAKYMQETIKSIDDIVYSVQNRMQLEKLIKGYDL